MLTAERSLLALSSVLLLSALPGCVIEEPDDDPSSPTPPWTPGETDAPNVAPCRADLEPNSGPQETTCVSLDTTISARLDNGDEDWYLLEIPEDYALNKVSIKAEDTQKDCFTGVDPYLEVGNSELILLYQNEDSYEDYCPRLSFPVKPGDTYLIRVATLWSLYGNYTLSVESGGAGSISGTVPVSSQRQALPSNTASAASGKVGPMMTSASALTSVRTPTQVNSPWQAQLQVPWSLAHRNSPASFGQHTIPVEPGEVLVRLRDTSALQRLHADLARREGLEVVQERPRLGGRYVQLRLSPRGQGHRPLSQAETWALVSRLRSWAGVEAADVNRVLEPHRTPDDSYYEDQWDLGPFPGMNLPPAWDISLGSDEVIVAVIDAGNESTHPDLNGKWVVGYDFISNADNAGDGSAEDAVPEDNLRNGHGAHVAGTIAAETNNGLGIAGIGWNVSYMPLRVCGNYGCTEADISEALWHVAGYETVADEGQSSARAHVANLSLGGHDFCSPMLQEVITAAESRGVVVVVSAGNSNDDAREYSPASCEGVITVGASDEFKQRASFSNYGPAVDISAPGTNILSTVDGGYASWQGTSMSSPHIAGLAALLKSINPTFSTETVLELMQQHVTTINCSGAESCGGGVPDAAEVLDAAQARADEQDVWLESLLVEAVDTSDANRRVSTFSQAGVFSLAPVPAGTWSIRAGVDLNANRRLDDTGEVMTTVAEPITITRSGETVEGVQLP